ncbi:MAG: hypothetical protein ACKOYC_00245 [Bacteroidota bacterium]
MDSTNHLKTAMASCLTLLLTICANAFASESDTIRHVMIYDNNSETVISNTVRKSFAPYNNDMYGSPILAIVKTSERISNYKEKKDSIITFLKREGIPVKELKEVEESDPTTLAAYELKAGCLYIRFIGSKQKYTNGGHPLYTCPYDTIIERETGYGLYYNLCDYNYKEKLPEVRVWGKETNNGYYTETPAKPMDYYVNNIISNFTVLRNDSDDVADGILIPVSKEFNERNVHLEKYLTRAYKWVEANSVNTAIISRNGRKYLLADIKESGHYRFTHEPLRSAAIICIKAPENTCFKEIILEHGTCSNWKGVLSDGKKTAFFVLPDDPSKFKCVAKLIDADGNTIDFETKQLRSAADISEIKEKDQRSYSIYFPGHKKVQATQVFELTNEKHGIDKPKISKL